MVVEGERIQLHAVGSLKDGLKFLDTRKAGEPFDFVVGSHAMLPAFERAILDMNPGETKMIMIPAAEAYGEYREDLIEEVPLDQFPNAEALPVGQFIEIETEDGVLRCKVLEPLDGKIRFDHNHELAGKDVFYEIELIDTVIESAIENEKHASGCACGCDRLKESLSK